jgi:tetratricopeptide (TPR) repeat protein
MAFERVLDGGLDLDTSLSVRTRVAEWCREQLDDDARAQGHYTTILEVDPENAGALSALEEIHQKSGSWTELAIVYRREIEATFEPDEKRRRLGQLARLQENQLADRSGAVESFLECMAIDDGDAEAIGALERLYEEGAEWSALADLQTRRSVNCYDEDELLGILEKLGTICRDQLGDAERAIEAFERMLEAQPEHEAAIGALLPMYATAERWPELHEVLLKALAATSDTDERLDCLRRIGFNAAENLQQSDLAGEYLAMLLEVAPGDRDAFESIKKIYREEQRWYDLVEVTRAHLGAISDGGDPEREIDLLVEVARIASEELFDGDVAIEALNQVLERDADHPSALNVLAQLYERDGHWEKAAETLERALGHAEGAAKGEAWRRLGRLYLEELDQPERAEEFLRKAAFEAGDGLAIDSLIQLARDAGDDATLLELLQARTSGLDGEARVPYLKQIGGLLDASGDALGSLRVLEEAVELAPDDVAAREELVERYLASEDYARAEALLGPLVTELENARRYKDLVGCCFRLGRAKEAQGLVDEAMAYFSKCFEHDATHVPNLMAMGRLHMGGGAWDSALRVFQTALLHQTKLERTERTELFYSLGRTRVELDDERRGRDMFNRVLSLDSTHEGALEALAAMDD